LQNATHHFFNGTQHISIMKNICLVFIAFLTTQTVLSQTLTQTNLPIIRINTNGRTIADEPKIDAKMEVIWQANNAINSVTDTNFHFKGTIGIELRGSTSQFASDKKPYSIEIRNDAGLDSSFALLGMPKESDWALTACSYDNSLIRDGIVYHLGSKIMAYAPRFRFVELILNANYRGVYMLTEKIKRDKNRVNVSKMDVLTQTGDNLTGGYIIKLDKLTGATSRNPQLFTSRISNNSTNNNFTNYLYHYPKPDSLNAEQRAYISNAVLNFETVMNSPNYADSATGYRKIINDTSFVDFFLMNELARNVDAYRLSTYLYKDKNSIDPRLKMGPLWDFNFSIGGAAYCQAEQTAGWAFKFNSYGTCGTDYWLVPFWWQKLFDDIKFRALIRTRWRAHRTSELTNVKITSLIDSLSITLLKDPQTRNAQRWAITSNYTNDINFIKNWLNARLIWLDGQINALTAVDTEGSLSATDLTCQISPNPVSNTLIINGSDALVGKKIVIKNILGESFLTNTLTGNTTELPVYSLPKGIYFLQIMGTEKTLKFVKQ
jgi:hypothetical protein